MRIAVNARFLNGDRPTGIGIYSCEILSRICRTHPEHQFIFFFDRPYDPGLIFSANVIPVVIGPRTRHPLMWFFWFEISISLALKKYKPDIFFSPDGFLSSSIKIPAVIVIHDINFFHRPHDLPFITRVYYNFFFPRFARKAIKICTVSEFSKTDISLSYKVPLEKIVAYHNGVREVFRALDENKKQIFRDKLTDGKPYFIFIGSIHPRKNLVNLLKAFDHFRKVSGRGFKLIILGREFFLNKEMKRIYRGMVYRDDVIFTGYVEEKDMAGILASAEALAMVSFYEGFGLPVVEAMMCDVPVIASDRAAIPEIAGDAAIYADPGDYLSISDAMQKLVFTEGLKESLIQKGRLRRQQFSWDKTAEGIWRTIEDTLQKDA
jgi:glycosyltransferase involved in cell wall biosynthesis